MNNVNKTARASEPDAATIAIVDDDLSVREAMDNLLSALGYSVTTFASAHAFLGSCAARHPACLIADVQMPGTTGIELLEQLRHAGLTIPTILVTAFPHASLRAKAMSVGAVDYLEKPVRQDDLLGSLQRALH